MITSVLMQGTVYYGSTCDLNTFAVGLAILFTGILLSLILYKTVSAVTQTECIVLSEVEHSGSLCYWSV